SSEESKVIIDSQPEEVSWGSALKEPKDREISIKDFVSFEELMNADLYRLSCANAFDDYCCACGDTFLTNELVLHDPHEHRVHPRCLSLTNH
ncbi:MAG: hypothetical protein ACK521_04405, partial [bacterium]